MKVWDAQTGKSLLSFSGHKAEVNSVCFSSKDQRLASGSTDKTVRVWDAPSGKPLLCLVGHTSAVIGVCFNPEGTQVISRDIEGTQITWDLTTGKPAATQGTYVMPATPRSPDGRLFAFKEDMRVRIHRLPVADLSVK